MKELAIRLDREGFQMHVRVIEDDAARQALAAIAAARAVNGVTDNRYPLAPLELVDPADIPRLDKLGVIANFKRFWMYADESFAWQGSRPGSGAATLGGSHARGEAAVLLSLRLSIQPPPATSTSRIRRYGADLWDR